MFIPTQDTQMSQEKKKDNSGQKRDVSAFVTFLAMFTTPGLEKHTLFFM